MHLILLDTSFQGALLGLAHREQKEWSLNTKAYYENPQEAATALPKMLHELLEKGGLTLEQIAGIVIGVGPGSFTGIKIGLSFAYGMKRANPRLELTGVSALRALSIHESFSGLSALPATGSAGYFVVRDGEDRKLGIVRGPEDPKVRGKEALWEIFERTEADREGATGLRVWPQNVNLLGNWPRLEEWLSESQIDFKNWPVNSLAEPLLQGMLTDYVMAHHASPQDKQLPQALYLRRSAPEEKLVPSSP